MRLTRTHALFYAQKKLPKALREHCQQVTIDDCINGHSVPPKNYKDPDRVHLPNTITVLKMRRKNSGENGMMALLVEMSKQTDNRGIIVNRWLKKINRKQIRGNYLCLNLTQ